MPRRYLLDTTFLVDHFRNEATATARMARLWSDGDELYVNEVTVCELFTGLRDSDRETGEALIRPLEFVQPGPDIAVLAGRWRRAARERGRTLSAPDALIAAAAHSLDAAVLTRNARDFALTPAKMETY